MCRFPGRNRDLGDLATAIGVSDRAAGRQTTVRRVPLHEMPIVQQAEAPTPLRRNRRARRKDADALWRLEGWSGPDSRRGRDKSPQRFVPVPVDGAKGRDGRLFRSDLRTPSGALGENDASRREARHARHSRVRPRQVENSGETPAGISVFTSQPKYDTLYVP